MKRMLHYSYTEKLFTAVYFVTKNVTGIAQKSTFCTLEKEVGSKR